MNKKLIIEKGGYRPTVSGPIEPPTSIKTTKQKHIKEMDKQQQYRNQILEFLNNFDIEFKHNNILKITSKEKDADGHSVFISLVKCDTESIIRECAKVADANYDKGFCPVGGFVLEHFNIKP
jgi:hypothetical protein